MNKYNARKVEYDGMKFDSAFERDRYIHLKGLEDLGIIKNLRRQVKFEIIPKQDGERSANYVADFVYEDETGKMVVEDTKGFVTPDYVLKRKLLLLVHGIKISEVRLGGNGKKHQTKHRKKQIRISEG